MVTPGKASAHHIRYFSNRVGLSCSSMGRGAWWASGVAGGLTAVGVGGDCCFSDVAMSLTGAGVGGNWWTSMVTGGLAAAGDRGDCWLSGTSAGLVGAGVGGGGRLSSRLYSCFIDHVCLHVDLHHDWLVWCGFVSLCLEVKKLLLLSWLRDSKTKAKMAFLYVFWADGVISSFKRENVHLNRCKWNLGSNSTQVNFPASSFSVMVAWVMMCEQAAVRRCLKRLRSLRLEGSKWGWEVVDVCGSIPLCEFNCSGCIFDLMWWSGPKRSSFLP